MADNTSKVSLADGREVLMSYGVPVAAFVPGRGYIRTAEKFSVTTSKHANGYAGKDSPQVQPAEFAELIAPVVARR